MVEIVIRRVRDKEDFDAARMLCREWLDWHWEHYPPDWPTGDEHPMDPVRFGAILETLQDIHKRPLGGVLIAWVGDTGGVCHVSGSAPSHR